MRIPSLLFCTALLGGVLFGAMSNAPVAHAQDSSRDSQARALFEAGATAYNGGRYEQALRYFREAYELSERPALLFNIGMSADRLRQDELALRSFEQYLEQVPDAPNREAAEARIQFLRSQGVGSGSTEPAEATEPTEGATETSAVVTTTTTTDPNETDSGGGSVIEEWWFWTIIAAVVVGAGVGIGVGVAASGGTQAPIEGDFPAIYALEIRP